MQEIINHFKAREGFRRLLGLMYDVYTAKGRVFGAVRLTSPNSEEEAAVSEFFKRDYYNQALIRISLADFQRQVSKYFSAEVSLGEILEEYHGLRANGKTLRKPGAFSSAVITEVMPEFENTIAAPWLKEMAAQTRKTYSEWARRHSANPDEVREEIISVAGALNSLPIDSRPTNAPALVPLSEFSAGRQELFGFDSTHGRLFLKALACRFNIPAPGNIEDAIGLHLRAGILSCGALSNVTVRGLGAKAHDGQSHSVCEFYNSLNRPFALTLENLSRFASVSAHGQKAFVVEDPLTFAELAESTAKAKITLILAGAQGFSAAFLHLTRLLRAAGITLYYSGGFNCKSLEQADKLYLDYGKSFRPLCYGIDSYNFLLGGKTDYLPSEKRSLALHNEELASLLSHMRKVGKAIPPSPMATAQLLREITACAE